MYINHYTICFKCCFFNLHILYSFSSTTLKRYKNEKHTAFRRYLQTDASITNLKKKMSFISCSLNCNALFPHIKNAENVHKMNRCSS